MKIQYIAILLLSFLFAGCSIVGKSSSSEDQRNMYKYAQVNCLFWYFSEKGYDTKDIRSISGGIVETSNISIDQFQEIALFMKSYAPEIKSKNNIDPKLARCFQLERSSELNSIIYSE